MKLVVIIPLFLLSLYGFSQRWQPSEVCPNSPFFIFKNDEGKSGVIDSDSNIVIQPIHENVFIARKPLIDSCAINEELAILINENSQIGVNLNSLQKTSNHRSMAIINNDFYFQDSTYWGIYDSNVRIIVDKMPGEPMVINPLYFEWALIPSLNANNSEYYSFYIPEKWRLYENDLIRNNNNFNDKVIAYTLVKEYAGTNYEKFEKWVNRNPVKHRFSRYFGLYDYSSGRKLKPDYHEISPIVFENELFYWCLEYTAIKNSNNSELISAYVDVRNSDLKKLKRLNFDQIPQNKSSFLFDYQIGSQNSELLIVLEYNSRFQAFDLKGETIISKSDRITLLENGTYEVWRGEELMFFNNKGELLE